MPELGKVKTRLATTMGDERTLDIYRHLTKMTISTIAVVPAEHMLFYYPVVQDDHPLPIGRYSKFLQVGINLGDKMQKAFEVALEQTDHAVIVGTDCPYLQPAHLEKAFNLLDTNDVVLGPALDGGYYLLGLKKVIPSLFQDMVWSTSSVFEETCRRAKVGGYSVTTLESLSDIDYEADWDQYCHWVDEQPGALRKLRQLP